VASRELASGVITIDTSALFARLNRCDPDHDRITRAMASQPGPWIVPAAILGEVGYLVEHRDTPTALDAFLLDLDEGSYVLDVGVADIARVRSLLKRYADLPLGLVDAFVIACAERNGGRVATLDWRHFGVVSREGTITIVPAE
jgi:predicted nucleic acid-binding protein